MSKNMLDTKKASWGGGIINLKSPQGMINTVVMLALGLGALALLLPTIVGYVGNLSKAMIAANIPFAEFFASNGLILLALGGAITVGIVAIFMGKGRK